MSAKTRRRQREQGTRKQANESKTAAAERGVESAENTSRPWKGPLRRILSRKRVELRKAGYNP